MGLILQTCAVVPLRIVCFSLQMWINGSNHMLNLATINNSFDTKGIAKNNVLKSGQNFKAKVSRSNVKLQ